MKVLGISGSLRKDSYNTKLLKLVGASLPEGVTFELANYRGVPLFNQELEKDVPASVLAFKRQIESADVIVFATPNYNGSIPGVLKNAIDWASRPALDMKNSFNGKVGMVIGGTPGMSGTLTAQLHLREIMANLNVLFVSQPRVLVSGINQMIDENGALVLDERNDELLKTLIEKTLTLVK